MKLILSSPDERNNPGSPISFADLRFIIKSLTYMMSAYRSIFSEFRYVDPFCRYHTPPEVLRQENHRPDVFLNDKPSNHISYNVI